METRPQHELHALTVRRLRVDLSKGFSRHWNGGDAFRTAFFNALSMSFPVGEQFFIDAVRAGSRHLPDTPANAPLLDAMRGFIGQEATHRHLHGLYNAHLTEQGLVNHWGRRAAQRVDQIRRELPTLNGPAHLHELAITVACEHITAILGDLTLEGCDQPGDWLMGAEEPLRTLWQWHAAEESEHKSVAFELFNRLGGSHALRLRWFRQTALELTVDLLRQTLHNLWRDGSLHRPSTWWSAVRFVFGRRGLVWRFSKPFVAYLRQDFHPDQLGQPALAAGWLRQHADRWTPVNSPLG